MTGLVAQQAARLAHIGARMAHVASAEIAVLGRFHFEAGGGRLGQGLRQHRMQVFQVGLVAHRHVVDLVERGCVLRGGGQQIGLHRVRDKAEIAAGHTVAVDKDGLAGQHRCGPFRDHGGIGTVRVLARAEYVEVAQPDRRQAVVAGKHFGIQLVDVFGHRIRRQGLADGVLDLGQAGVVAIGRAAGGVDKALHTGVACGDQHVQKAGHIGGIGGDRVGQ